MKSLKSSGHLLATEQYQLEVLNATPNAGIQISFEDSLKSCGLFPLKPIQIETLQINLGKMCNQVCRHCHVDAGPDRKEIMKPETMQNCIEVLRKFPQLNIVDLTGGAPELNPDFRWFVKEISMLKRKIIVRCNLTIILANKRFHDLPEFYQEHEVEIVSSLPFYLKDRTDRQRGDGVFEDSIKALQMLNRIGYGIPGSNLTLNLVYNPAGAFLPTDQTALERDFKATLLKEHDIFFNNLFTITNMPISRYLHYLLESGNYTRYMRLLHEAFNSQAASNVMCRSTISVSWDGFLYDCDFNQMLNLRLPKPAEHITGFDLEALLQREIITNQHCFGCTAGAGSSCGGAVA